MTNEVAVSPMYVSYTDITQGVWGDFTQFWGFISSALTRNRYTPVTCISGDGHTKVRIRNRRTFIDSDIIWNRKPITDLDLEIRT